MPAPMSSDVRLFYQTALQRFEDSRVLMEADRTTASIYLAGYAVECALKALLLANTPKRRQNALTATFRGKIGHDLEWLKQQLLRAGVSMPGEVSKQLAWVRSSWSTDLRYVPGPIKRKEALEFSSMVEKIISWVKERI